MIIDKSAELDKLATALSSAQSIMKGAVKDATNPHFRTTYADLSSVWDAARAPLTANGLSVSQHPGPLQDGTVSLTTMILHTSGQYLTSMMSAPVTQGNPQAVGSAVTYLRRYALAAVVGIAPEDDDGQAASAPRHDTAPHHGRAPTPAPAPSPEFNRTVERTQQAFPGSSATVERIDGNSAPTCPKCGSVELWDNRARKASGQGNPKAPDFSCKDKVCGGAIWPARTGGSRSASAPKPMAPIDQAPPPSDDDMPF